MHPFHIVLSICNTAAAIAANDGGGYFGGGRRALLATPLSRRVSEGCYEEMSNARRTERWHSRMDFLWKREDGNSSSCRAIIRPLLMLSVDRHGPA